MKHRKNVIAHSFFGPQIKILFGNDVSKLVLEQLQSDEESTDSEAGENEKNEKLKVIRPSWRSEKAIEAFKKFDEFDLQIRKNAKKERELKEQGRFKTIEIKKQYLDQAPSWSKA
jgi:hypothetical protein